MPRCVWARVWMCVRARAQVREHICCISELACGRCGVLEAPHIHSSTHNLSAPVTERQREHQHHVTDELRVERVCIGRGIHGI